MAATGEPTSRRSFWSRNPWVLPAILVLLILAIVLGVTFRSKIRSLASSSTATPTASSKQVVVTATAGPGATAVVITATPSGAGTGSTPLPGATPVPTVRNLRLGMITHPQNQVATIQSGADQHNPAYSYYLDPMRVVQKDLPNYGFTGTVQVLSPSTSGPTPTPFIGADSRPLVNVDIQYNGKKYKVSLAQVDKHGPGGIWLIVTIVQL